MTKSKVDDIINYLKAFIERNNLEVLSRYPNDLLVHDRNQFTKLAAPGMRFGWKADHSSTHLITIGVHLKEMELIPTLAGLTSASKYLEIFIPYVGPVCYTEHTSETFAQLANKEVPFRMVGEPSDFMVYRGARRLGRIVLENKGYFNDSTPRTFEANIYEDPTDGSAKDIPVLRIWAEHAITTCAGTLFVRSVINHHDRDGARLEDFAMA